MQWICNWIVKVAKLLHSTLIPRNVPDLYSEALIAEGVLSEGDVTSAIKEHTDLLNDHFKQIETFQPKRENLKEQWTGLKEPTSSITLWDSGLPEGKILIYIG